MDGVVSATPTPSSRIGASARRRSRPRVVPTATRRRAQPASRPSRSHCTHARNAYHSFRRPRRARGRQGQARRRVSTSVKRGSIRDRDMSSRGHPPGLRRRHRRPGGWFGRGADVTPRGGRSSCCRRRSCQGASKPSAKMASSIEMAIVTVAGADALMPSSAR